MPLVIGDEDAVVPEVTGLVFFVFGFIVCNAMLVLEAPMVTTLVLCDVVVSVVRVKGGV